MEDLEHWISDQQEWQQEHLVAWLFGAFAVLALALAAVGLYSVVSYSVAQRTNEFGIRMALGAQRSHVLGIVFASTVTSVGGGIAGGLLLAVALNKVLGHWAAGQCARSADSAGGDPRSGSGRRDCVYAACPARLPGRSHDSASLRIDSADLSRGAKIS